MSRELAFLQIFPKVLQIIIRANYYQFIERVEPLVSSRYIDSLLSPDNRYDIYVALVPEV